MKVELKPGEALVVTFADSDGEITVTFGREAIVVHADLADTSGREGIIYREIFRRPPKQLKAAT